MGKVTQENYSQPQKSKTVYPQKLFAIIRTGRVFKKKSDSVHSKAVGHYISTMKILHCQQALSFSPGIQFIYNSMCNNCIISL